MRVFSSSISAAPHHTAAPVQTFPQIPSNPSRHVPPRTLATPAFPSSASNGRSRHRRRNASSGPIDPATGGASPRAQAAADPATGGASPRARVAADPAIGDVTRAVGHRSNHRRRDASNSPIDPATGDATRATAQSIQPSAGRREQRLGQSSRLRGGASNGWSNHRGAAQADLPAVHEPACLVFALIIHPSIVSIHTHLVH
ncbi:NK1 transcription factor-related protein 1-like [Hordeum vulgare subsp. vulgare]|uniref:NK1 transcription factor-related protein 1-like n=1 Tax=Hordeum vulgare subsp. vulgare TaxID=112509 RepID=UPI001D1A3B60|nr:NK1 transcription factor-related protein 1-like [Hordeum vulgare subsp. vulgare]